MNEQDLEGPLHEFVRKLTGIMATAVAGVESGRLEQTEIIITVKPDGEKSILEVKENMTPKRLPSSSTVVV